MGTAYYFNGSNAYVYMDVFNNVPSSYLTICALFRTSVSDAFIVQLNRNSSNINNEMIFRIRSSKLQFWDYSTQYGFPETQTSVNNIATGNWRLGCFVKSSTTGNYYIDGALDSQVTANVNVSYGNRSFAVGMDYRDKKYYFNGFIAGVYIYNRALSSTEIQQIYNTPNNPPTNGLVLWFSNPDFTNDCCKAIWRDKSGNGNNGQLYNVQMAYY